jgi:large subunit ribosomal protein L15
MNLNDVNRGIKKFKGKKRLGRGKGSGQGKTAGRGHKGQRARAGFNALSIWEGGQMPLVRRIPKRGFNNKFADSVAIVNIEALEDLFEANAEVNVETLREKRVIRGSFDALKVLGDGQLTKPLKVSAHRFSATAAEKIRQAGGEVIVLPGPKPVVKNKQHHKDKERDQQAK